MDIIVDSHAVVQNYAEGSCVSFTQSTLIVIFYKTIEQYYIVLYSIHTGYNIDTIHPYYSHVASFTCTHLCVYAFSAIKFYHV